MIWLALFTLSLDQFRRSKFQGSRLRRIFFYLASVSAAIGCAVAFPFGASAHHTLDALYDISLEVEAVATLQKADWINPHVWMRFDIEYPNGRIEKDVLVESLAVAGLRQIGINQNTLRAGSEYGITYHPTRNGGRGGFLTSITLDGTVIHITTRTRPDS